MARPVKDPAEKMVGMSTRWRPDQMAWLDQQAKDNDTDKGTILRSLVDAAMNPKPVGARPTKRQQPAADGGVKGCVHPMSRRSKGFCYECGSQVGGK